METAQTPGMPSHTEWERARDAGLAQSAAARELAAVLDVMGCAIVSADLDRLRWIDGDSREWGTPPPDVATDGGPEIIGADGGPIGRLVRHGAGPDVDLDHVVPHLERWMDRLRERAILDDVSSELIRDHRVLRTRVTDLEDNSERLQRFAFGVAHELGRPLATMAMTVEAMRLSMPEVSPLASTLTERIGDEVDHLQRLVTMLMDVAAATATAREVDHREVVHDVERAVAAECLRWHLDTAPELVPAAVAMIVTNLAENAVKYGEASATTPAEITIAATSGALTVEVSDRGPGLEGLGDDEAFSLFASEGGTGVGLAVVDQIVRDAGGDVRAIARDGGGLTVRIELPVSPTAQN